MSLASSTAVKYHFQVLVTLQMAIVYPVVGLQPANIMFSLVDSTSSRILLEPPEYSPVEWIEGVEVTDSAPQY
jgi:hypothetical protein